LVVLFALISVTGRQGIVSSGNLIDRTTNNKSSPV
jgi:hypothetical protein